MKWFKHMSDLPRDEDVAHYLDVAGKDRVSAYGFLILVLEAIAARMGADGDLVCSATYSIPQWGRITYSHPNRVRKYLRLCEVIGWVQVRFEGGSCEVSIPRMVRWRDEYARKSGLTRDKVAQSREEQIRPEQRESTNEGPPSDCLTAGTQSRKPPPDFEITKGLQDWAAKNHPSVDIRKETEKFLLHEFPKPLSDWDSAWKRWIIRAVEYHDKHNGTVSTSDKKVKLMKLGKELNVKIHPGESEEQYLDRVQEINDRRVESLNS